MDDFAIHNWRLQMIRLGPPLLWRKTWWHWKASRRTQWMKNMQKSYTETLRITCTNRCSQWFLILFLNIHHQIGTIGVGTSPSGMNSLQSANRVGYIGTAMICVIVSRTDCSKQCSGSALFFSFLPPRGASLGSDLNGIYISVSYWLSSSCLSSFLGFVMSLYFLMNSWRWTVGDNHAAGYKIITCFDFIGY